MGVIKTNISSRLSIMSMYIAKISVSYPACILLSWGVFVNKFDVGVACGVYSVVQE